MDQEQKQTKQGKQPTNEPQQKPKYTLRLNMFKLPPEQRSRLADLYFGGMLAISAVLFPNLLSQPSPDMPNFLALLCFSVALPTLATALITKFGYKRITISTAITGFIGTICAYFGILFS